MRFKNSFAVLAGFWMTTICAVAQLAPQPFLAPPRLQESAASGGNLLRSQFKLTGLPPQGCNPDGDITRTLNSVNVNLNVRYLPNQIRNPGDTGVTPVIPPKMDTVILRSYGGCLSGPLIELNPGNTLRIKLHNELDTNDPSCPGGPNSTTDPGCFNTINLHYHGLHVSPSGNSDNVLLNIAPNSKFDYEVNVPDDHPAGTFWYHAHRHGSTSLQVASGASGVLIVRGSKQYTGGDPGDLDTILHDAAGKPFAEQVFLFQQIPYGCFLQETSGPPYQRLVTESGLMTASTSQKTPWICPASYTDPSSGNTYKVTSGVVENFGIQLASPTVWDYSARFTSINGAVQPVLPNIEAGEIQRWRMVHGGIHDTVNVQVVRMKQGGDKRLAAMSLAGAFNGTPQEQRKLIEEICPVLLPDGTPTGGIVPQFEVASDGLTQTHLRKIGTGLKDGGISSNFLQPGYRSDILIAFPEPATYCVLNEAAPADERPTNGGGGGQGPNTTQLLATVIVTGGKPVQGDLELYVKSALYAGNQTNLKTQPAALAGLKTGDLTPWSPKFNLGVPANAGNPLPIEFKISSDTRGVGFYVNDKSYDPDRVDQTRQVDTTDDWVLTAVGGGGIPAEPHIFHIHVNPFEVMDVVSDATNKSIFGPNGECLVTEAGLNNQYCGMLHKFKDTVFVQNGYHVLIRTKYDRYIGEFVIHCHILDHEDSGMMTNISIVPDASAPGGGLGMPGMKHDHAAMKGKE